MHPIKPEIGMLHHTSNTSQNTIFGRTVDVSLIKLNLVCTLVCLEQNDNLARALIDFFQPQMFSFDYKIVRFYQNQEIRIKLKISGDFQL